MDNLNNCFTNVYLQLITFTLPIFAYYTAAYFFAGGMGDDGGIAILKYGSYYYGSIFVTLLIPSEIHQQVSYYSMCAYKRLSGSISFIRGANGDKKVTF